LPTEGHHDLGASDPPGVSGTRWDIGGREQLLAHIRSGAKGTSRPDFIASILFTAKSSGECTDRMLVDSQQRVEI